MDARTTHYARTTTHYAGSYAGSYTEAQLATWLGWAYRVACQPCVYTEPALLASAEARIARLEAGQVLATDVQGLVDWATELGW